MSMTSQNDKRVLTCVGFFEPSFLEDGSVG